MADLGRGPPLPRSTPVGRVSGTAPTAASHGLFGRGATAARSPYV